MPAPRRRGGAPALLLGTTLLLSLAQGPAMAQGAGGGPRIAAIVNEAVITTGDLNDRVGLVTATAGVPDDPEVRRRLSQQVLRGFIDEKLQLQEAQRLKLSVTDAEVDQTLGVLAQRNRLDVAAFKKALEERGIPERVLRAQLRGQLSWAKVVNKELRSRVAVTAEQVEQALREAAAGGGEVELLLAEILLPVDSADDEPRVLREAQGLAATLRDGGDFAALARQVSVASSAKEGGEIGWVRPATMLPELRPRLLPLPAGGVSDPIATPAGVHVFKVRERRSPGESPGKRLVVTKVSLAQILLPLAPDAKPPLVKAAEARARELRPGLKGCGDIDTYAKRTRSEGSGSLGWLNLTDLPGPLRQVVGGLQPNQPSEPVRGPLGIQLLMVCDRQGREETIAAPPPPPPPTRETVRQRLEDEQLERLATRYLRDLRRDAYIDLRLNA